MKLRLQAPVKRKRKWSLRRSRSWPSSIQPTVTLSVFGRNVADRTPDSQPDSWLSRINHLSQIGLFALAVVGYVYTVRPLYSKALLEEQIAERELDLKRLASERANLQQIVENLQKSVDSRMREYERMAASLSATRELSDSTQRRLNETKSRLFKTDITLSLTSQALATPESDFAATKANAASAAQSLAALNLETERLRSYNESLLASTIQQKVFYSCSVRLLTNDAALALLGTAVEGLKDIIEEVSNCVRWSRFETLPEPASSEAMSRGIEIYRQNVAEIFSDGAKGVQEEYENRLVVGKSKIDLNFARLKAIRPNASDANELFKQIMADHMKLSLDFGSIRKEAKLKLVEVLAAAAYSTSIPPDTPASSNLN